MTVRLAKASDAKGIAEVHIASWQSAYRGIFPDSYLDNLSVERSGSFWEKEITEGKNHILVFELETQIIGFAAFGASRDDDVDQTIVGEIYAIYFDLPWWGKGYGSVLCQEAVGTLRNQGFSEVSLWVLAENSRAKKFYIKMGFKQDGAEKVETWKDDIEMHEVRFRQDMND